MWGFFPSLHREIYCHSLWHSTALKTPVKQKKHFIPECRYLICKLSFFWYTRTTRGREQNWVFFAYVLFPASIEKPLESAADETADRNTTRPSSLVRECGRHGRKKEGRILIPNISDPAWTIFMSVWLCTLSWCTCTLLEAQFSI